MCSLAPIPHPASIGLYRSDEVLFISLDKMMRGYSIPENVTADVNPYQHRPSDLRDDIWYFLRSEQKKDSGHGFWKARGEACKIYSNSDINGWRNTLDFYEGQSPQGRRTDWVIQEYRITQRGLHSNSNPKESSSLCSLFHSYGARCSAAEVARNSNIHQSPSAVPFSGTGGTTEEGRVTETQARNRGDITGPLAAVGVLGELQNIPVERPDDDYFLGGDYLELNDLVDSESRSFSSDNSSYLTYLPMTSEEWFDSLALLQDLNDEINRDEQAKDANFKRSVAAPVRPSEVVMHAETLGSLICNNGRQPPPEAKDNKVPKGRVSEIAVNCQKAEKGNEGTSRNPAASSSTHKADGKGGKNALGDRIKNLKRKYMPF